VDVMAKHTNRDQAEKIIAYEVSKTTMNNKTNKQILN
jgi:hypothetical protein